MSEVLNVLTECVEINQLHPAPQGFDKFWKTRRGVSPAFLFNIGME